MPRQKSADASVITEVRCGRPGKRAYDIKGQRFEISSRYEPIGVVGVGAYGLVVSANDLEGGRRVAIKRVDGLFENLTDAKRILREIRLMRCLSHENVLPLSDMEDPPTEDFDEIYMYSPLFDRDLSRVISSGAALADEHVKYFVWQMCCGLHYIHSASILHRDMKPANCLVTTSCDLALCDFGLARYVDARDDVGGAMTEYVVTRWFRPPELVLTQMYTAAVDMWGLGCIFAQLLGRKPLFPGRDFKDQVEVICSIIGKPTEEQMAHIDSPRAREFVSKLPDVPPVSFKALFPDAPDDALHLLAGLLRFAPGERLTAAEALKHPYLEEYHDEEFETVVDEDFDADELEPRRADGLPLTREDISALLLREIGFFRPAADVLQ